MNPSAFEDWRILRCNLMLHFVCVLKTANLWQKFDILLKTPDKFHKVDKRGVVSLENGGAYFSPYIVTMGEGHFQKWIYDEKGVKCHFTQ